MTSEQAGRRNYSLSRKEGWLQLVDAPPRQRPDQLTVAELKALSGEARADYDHRREVWHANLGPFATPQLTSIHDDMWEVVASNQQDGDRVKGSIALDGFPGLGKTTIVNAFGRDFRRAEITRHGPDTIAGHQRLPVCRVGLTSNTTMRSLNQAICEFYGHPAPNRGTAAQLASRALDCILSCETQLLVIDDVHFVNVNRRDGVEVANHFKWLANEFPVTFVFVGVGIERRGLTREGLVASDTAMAQTARRWTRLGIEPFEIFTEQGRRDWRSLLLTIERRIVLADAYRGMVVDDLADYLFARSTGHIGSLMTLITRGCYRAIRTGQERLTIDLLDGVRNDEAAETARRELQEALHAGRLTAQASRRAAAS